MMNIQPIPGSLTGTTSYPPAQPCPSCGRCPTCGHQPAHVNLYPTAAVTSTVPYTTFTSNQGATQ